MTPFLLLVLSGLAEATESPPATVPTLTLPTATLSWRDGVAALHIWAPAGEHVAPEAPARVSLSVGSVEEQLETTGEMLSRSILFAAPRANVPVAASISLSLCADGGSSCRVVDLRVHGEFPTARKGEGYSLDVLPPVSDDKTGHSPMPIDAVFARARLEQKPVLLDFTAIWCPPCQQLRAEVLEDPANATDMAAVLVAAVDVDRPESWALKDRYKVGGYPTLVLVDAEGKEIDRSVGYKGEADFTGWLSRSAAGASPLSALPTPDSQSAAEALRIAHRLAGVERAAEAGPYLARVEAVGGSALAQDPLYHITRLLLHEEVADATWLAASGPPAQIGDWIWVASGLTEKDPGLKSALRTAIIRALPVAPAAQAADLCQVLGDISPEPEKKAWYGAAIQLTGARLTGDPAHDRGFWAGLIELHEGAGDPAGARKILDEALRAYPEEFTWHHTLAGQLLAEGKAVEAQKEAELAYGFGYGDNRLRAAERLARARAIAGDNAGAIAFIDEVLLANPRPPAGLQVRTGRYLDKLVSTRAELTTPPKVPPPAGPAAGKGR